MFIILPPSPQIARGLSTAPFWVKALYLSLLAAQIGMIAVIGYMVFQLPNL